MTSTNSEWPSDGKANRRRGSAATRPISQSNSSHFPKQKPVEWISSLIQRYQDQLPTLTGKTIDRETRELLNTTHSCIINVSKHHLHLVVLALIRVLKAVNASRWTSDVALSQSRLVVLETLLACLNEASPPVGRNVDRECCMKSVLEEMAALIGSNPVGEKATLVVGRVGALHPSLMLSRCDRALASLHEEEDTEEQTELSLSEINLMGFVTFEMETVIRVLQLGIQWWPPRKEHVEGVCVMMSSILWRWIEKYPDQFSTLQHSPQPQITEVCDGLFSLMNCAEMRRRTVCWPVQMILLAVSPCSLEAIAHAESDTVNLPPIIVTKRHFVDTVVSTVASYGSGQRPLWSIQLQSACHAAVNLCKCATYVNLSDFFVFNVVQQLIEHVKVVLLTGARPREMDRAILVDCFVALFRLKFDNDVFRVCLTSNQPLLQLVLIEALHTIAEQPRMHWWPRIDMVMSRSDQLRTLLMQVLEKVVEQDPVPSGHLPLSVSRSWHKMSGRWRMDRPSSASLQSTASQAECSQHTILIAILRLITTQPTLLIRKRTTTEENCIESVVSGLVLLIDHPILHSHTMQALLSLHTVIPQWNTLSSQDALATFCSVSSHMLFSVCQKLIHFQTSNAEHVITWLKALIQYRIEYLQDHYHLITEEMLDGITYQSMVKFEVVCFLYLWNCDSDLVQCCFSLFALHAAQCSMLPNLQLDLSLARQLSTTTNILTAGRIALQKSVNRHLRGLPHSNIASHEAWHETLRVWELFNAQLVSGSKDHADFVDHVTRVTTGTAVSSDAAAALVDAWSNMSGFLCSFCHLIYAKEPNHVTSFVSRMLSVLRVTDSPGKDLMCKCVKELLSYELDTSLDHFLLHSMSAQLGTHSAHAQFVEHVIYIVRNILSRRQVVVLRVDSTQQMLNALLLHSQQSADRTPQHKMMFTKKLCGLLQLILSNGAARRIPPPLQSRLLEHLSSSLTSLPPAHPFNVSRTETLHAILGALAKLLSNISIAIPTNTFNKIFSQLLDAFQEPSLSHSSPVLSRTPLEETMGAAGAADLTRRTNENVLVAIAALVNANPDLGVVRVVETSWGGSRRTRGWALDALSRVLRADSPARRSGGRDREGRQSELLRLLTLSTEEGALPLVGALANSVPSDSMDRVCRVVVTAFSERGRLSELLWAVLWQEAESALSPSTLYRGSSFAAKLIGYCFRVFGHAYLLSTLRPLIQEMTSTQGVSYEIEIERMSQHGPRAPSLVADGVIATRRVAEKAFQLIFDSIECLPPKLRILCRQLYLVINTRFPQSGLSALGKILFLRFFNPAIVTPFEMQLCPRRPDRNVARGLMLVSKILQTTVNQPTTNRDSGMKNFADLISEKMQPVNNFLSLLVSIDLDEDGLLDEVATSTSVNSHLLYNTHSLFINDRAEIVRQLRYTCASSNLCSRVDALLQSLPEDPPLPPANAEGLDPTLPYFYQLSTTSQGLPVYALILRRLQNVESETAVRTISERCARAKWVCLLDGMCCYDPPHLQKLMSADSFAHIESVVVLHCSSPLLARLADHFALFNTLHIDFDPVGARIPLDGLPPLTRSVMTGGEYATEATLIGSEDVQVTVRIVENLLCISGSRRWSERPALVSDFYQCSDFEQLELIDPQTLSMIAGDAVVSLRLPSARDLLNKLGQVRDRASAEADTEARVPFRSHYQHMVSLALVNLADPDVGVRATAYRLLNSLASTLGLPIATRLQETPCVLVPSNCSRLLLPLVTSLVKYDPQLLTALVPKVLDMANMTLIDSLQDSWTSLGQLAEESRNEVISHIVNVCQEGGSLASVICSQVWPRIGQLDERVLNGVIDRLLSVSPLSASLEMVQALATSGPQFPSLIVQRSLDQLTTAHPNSQLPKLIAFLLILTFDSTALKLDTHLPSILHIVACISGTGSTFLRYATFAIVNNIFHSFGTNPEYQLNAELHRSLSLFLRQLSSEDSMRLFRVTDCDSGQAVVNAAIHMVDQATGRTDSDTPRDIEEDMPALQPLGLGDLHQLLTLIIAVLRDLEGGLGGGHSWLTEWRKIARHWAFQGGSDMQIRSLIAFSCLADSISDQDMKSIVQLLVQVVVKRRDSLTAMAGVSLALIRLHTLTASNSPIHRLVFWIAILMFQLEHATIYEYAIQLLHANLSNLDHMGMFEHTSLEKMAMDSRAPLEWDLKALDQCAGLSFRANFNFALVGYLVKGLRQPYISVKVVQLLQLILRITAKSNHQDPYVLTVDNIPYLLALLPFDEKVQQRFRLSPPRNPDTTRAVLSTPWSSEFIARPHAEEPVVVSPWSEEEEEESGTLLDPSIICGEQAQSLAVTVLAILARSCPNVHLILDYLLEAVTVFPTVVPVIECLLDQRIVGLVQSCQSAPMLSTVVRLIETSALGEPSSGPQQPCSFLQQCGFAGLWRYAGAFLSPRASLQAINANLCSCLECILASI